MHTVILRKKDTSPVRTPVPCGQGQSQFLQSGQSRREAQRQEKPVLPGQQPNGRPEEQQQPRRQQLPEEQVREQPYRRVKSRTAIAPFTLVGMLTVACLMILVIFGYVQLFEASSSVSKLENQLANQIGRAHV